MLSRDCGVIIVAGGSGSRMGGGVPKQFRPLRGKPLLCWSVEFFQGQTTTSEIVIVVPQDTIEQAQQLCGASGQVSVKFVAGGSRRQDSVYSGLRNLSDASAYIAIHDAARPFPPANYAELVSCARDDGAAIFALPVTDSIKRVECGSVCESVPRSGLWAAQTPQVFRADLLRAALESCDSLGIEVTDDAAAVERQGAQVAVVEGTRTNLKVTLAEDFPMAEALAALMEGK